MVGFKPGLKGMDAQWGFASSKKKHLKTHRFAMNLIILRKIKYIVVYGLRAAKIQKFKDLCHCHTRIRKSDMRNKDPHRENVENILAICLPIMAM